MITKYTKISIIGDERWGGNTFLIESVINHLSDKSVLLVKEGSEISKIIRKYSFIKGLETVGYVSNWLESKEANLICNQSLIKESKPEFVIIFSSVGNKETSINDYESIGAMCLINKIPLIIIYEDENIKDIHNIILNYRCPECGEKSVKDINDRFEKFCSEECILKDHPSLYNFLQDQITEIKKEPKTVHKSNSFQHIEDCTKDEFKEKCCKTFKNTEDNISFKEKKEIDKFQKIILIEAKRHAYLQKKEDYKRQMKRMGTSRDKKMNNVVQCKKPNHPCKAFTKKDKKPCSNNSLDGSNYCGIPSHKAMGCCKQQV